MHYLGFISLDLHSSEFITAQHGFYHRPHFSLSLPIWAVIMIPLYFRHCS